MKALTYDRFGGGEVLHLAEIARPVPAAGEVLVAVHASSVNVIDSRVRKGLMGPMVNKRFPKIPGADLAGTVEALGAGVSDFQLGEAVFGAVDAFRGGAFAEAVAVPASQLARKPEGLGFEAAATIPIAGLAALHAIVHLGKVGAGTDVLIHGASGAVGLFAVEIARSLGATVTAVTGTSGVEAVRSRGAHTIIDYRKQDGQHFDQNFDVILDASGAMPYARGKAFLKPGGRLVEPSPTIPAVIVATLLNPFRSRKHLMLITAPDRARLETLAAFALEKRITPLIAKSYPLDEAATASAEMERGGVVGKIVVTMR